MRKLTALFVASTLAPVLPTSLTPLTRQQLRQLMPNR